MDTIDVPEAEVLRELTQTTRFTLIQNVLAHPKQAPSTHELDYANPSKNVATIYEHLHKLDDLGVIEKVELPDEKVQRDLPHVFWRLTDTGRELLERHDLVVAEETLQDEWERLEKTEKVVRYQNAPRPAEVESD